MKIWKGGGKKCLTPKNFILLENNFRLMALSVLLIVMIEKHLKHNMAFPVQMYFNTAEVFTPNASAPGTTRKVQRITFSSMIWR